MESIFFLIWEFKAVGEPIAVGEPTTGVILTQCQNND